MALDLPKTVHGIQPLYVYGKIKKNLIILNVHKYIDNGHLQQCKHT